MWILLWIYKRGLFLTNLKQNLLKPGIILRIFFKCFSPYPCCRPYNLRLKIYVFQQLQWGRGYPSSTNVWLEIASNRAKTHWGYSNPLLKEQSHEMFDLWFFHKISPAPSCPLFHILKGSCDNFEFSTRFDYETDIDPAVSIKLLSQKKYL